MSAMIHRFMRQMSYAELIARLRELHPDVEVRLPITNMLADVIEDRIQVCFITYNDVVQTAGSLAHDLVTEQGSIIYGRGTDSESSYCIVRGMPVRVSVNASTASYALLGIEWDGTLMLGIDTEGTGR